MSNTRKRVTRRALAGATAGLVALSGLVSATASPAMALEGFELARVAGDDRFETAAAVALATAADLDPDTVVVANGLNFPDALAGSYVAGLVGAPILLVQPDAVPEATLAALTAIDPDNIIVLGGTAAVSGNVATRLGQVGTVTRIAGVDRYETAEEAATFGEDEEVFVDDDGNRTVFLATGENFADALAAGPIAYAQQVPIVLTTPNALSTSAREALSELEADRVIVLGGTAAVSDEVTRALTGLQVDRLAGGNRAETAALIAELAVEEFGFELNQVGLANGASFADALAAAPHAAVNGFPLLLTQGANVLGDATEQFLTENAVTLQDGFVYGGPEAVSDEVIAEAEAAGGDGDGGTGGAVTVTNANVTQGGPVAGSITGDVQSVTVSGAGFTNQTLTDADPNAAGFQFSQNLAANAPTGEQTLTFTIRLADGTTVTRTATITVAAASGGVTTRPELVSARIVGTVESGQQSPTNPLGTTVSYTFDENVNTATSGAGSIDLSAFRVYAGSGVPTSAAAPGTPAGAASAVVSATGNTVTVLYSGITTAAGAAALTTATVLPGAVNDLQGQTNPEGDAPIGTGGGATPQPAGTTDAPDLLSVGGFRQAAAAGTTAVDFTFDEAAFAATGAAATDFVLVLNNRANQTSGSLITATAVPSGTTTGGGTVTGGQGTTTLTLVFANPDGPDDNTTPGDATDPQLAATEVARAVVLEDAVRDNEGTPNLNPLQAATAANQPGTTTGPDLVSVALQAATATAGAGALFTFDVPVEIPSAITGNFRVYDVTGAEVVVANTAATINPNNAAQVFVPLTGGIANIVGGSVEAAAVRAPAVPGTGTTPAQAAINNALDEEGVANAASSQPAGRTAGPDLTGVALTQAPGSGPFPQAGNFQATFTFDEDVTTTLPATGLTRFSLYLADGTRLTPTTGTTPTFAPTTNAVGSRNTVTISGWDVVVPGGTNTTATSAQVQSAVLGTVGGNVVNASDAGPTNVEGAERTTGGNGTARS